MHAEPGEVLVTRTVTDLVAGSGLSFSDRGEHVLKPDGESWRLFAAISGPDARAAEGAAAASHLTIT